MKLISAKSTEHYQQITIETGSWIFKKRTTYVRSKKNRCDIFKVTKSGMEVESWGSSGYGYTICKLMNYLEDTNQLQDTTNL